MAESKREPEIVELQSGNPDGLGDWSKMGLCSMLSGVLGIWGIWTCAHTTRTHTTT